MDVPQALVERQRLYSLAMQWRARAFQRMACADRTEHDWGRRVVEHGAFGLFNCCNDLLEILEEMDRERFIEITGIDLRHLVKVAYRLSRPYGVGLADYREGGLSEEEVDAILSLPEVPVDGHTRLVLNMDYVHGRAVKMAVWAVAGVDLGTGQKVDRLYIEKVWFRHGPEELCTLLTELGVEQIPLPPES